MTIEKIIEMIKDCERLSSTPEEAAELEAKFIKNFNNEYQIKELKPSRVSWANKYIDIVKKQGTLRHEVEELQDFCKDELLTQKERTEIVDKLCESITLEEIMMHKICIMDNATFKVYQDLFD